MIAVEHVFLRLSRFASLVGFVALACIVTDAAAQTRATLIRDTDNPALAPLRSHTYTNGGSSISLGAVPAGKRLVIQNVSYSGSTQSNLLYAQMKNQANGDDRLELGLPVPVYISGTYYYNYTTPATAYFEAGEIPTVIFTANSGSIFLDVVVTGYYVTP